MTVGAQISPITSELPLLQSLFLLIHSGKVLMIFNGFLLDTFLWVMWSLCKKNIRQILGCASNVWGGVLSLALLRYTALCVSAFLILYTTKEWWRLTSWNSPFNGFFLVHKGSAGNSAQWLLELSGKETEVPHPGRACPVGPSHIKVLWFPPPTLPSNYHSFPASHSLLYSAGLAKMLLLILGNHILLPCKGRLG